VKGEMNCGDSYKHEEEMSLVRNIAAVEKLDLFKCILHRLALEMSGHHPDDILPILDSVLDNKSIIQDFLWEMNS
jgi:hypothetical protein